MTPSSLQADTRLDRVEFALRSSSVPLHDVWRREVGSVRSWIEKAKMAFEV